MNPRMLLRLCSFTYFDLPQFYARRLEAGQRVALGEVARALRRMDELGALQCGAYRETADETFTALEDAPLDILAYENDNARTGFVAYAFGGARGEVVVCVRGSETRGLCAPSNIDWRDNFCAPLTGSVQTEAAVAFADRYEKGSLLLCGHSKGGNIAMLAQCGAANPLARAVAFNAQGFACGQVSGAQKARLRAGAVNYVVESDLIGALLCHPEARFFVRKNPEANAHDPAAFAFDPQGWPVRGRRTLLSVAVQALSCVLAFLNRNDEAGLLRSILRCGAPLVART